jgi:glycosyltransferase involved in cell wall biosynthesis
MSVKRYGIYIAYAPTVDLRNEGLGRYLANLVRGATESTDVDFVIACPSWSKEALEDLFRSEGLATQVSIIHPIGKPWLLRSYETYQKVRARRPRQRPAHNKSGGFLEWLQDDVEKRLVQIHSPRSLLPLLLYGFTLSVLLLLYVQLLGAKSIGARLRNITARTFAPLMGKLSARLKRLTHSPKDNSWVRRQLQSMNEIESKRMQALIEARKDVIAWYSPTAFWPAFNELRVPRLMCVPDVVLSDFSIGFSSVGGDRFLETFKSIEHAIRTASHLVTYSEQTKWHTLADRFSVPASRISVVRHAPSTLHHLIDIEGFPDSAATSRHYCWQMLFTALQRTDNPYTAFFCNEQVRFLFYPSQVRPNKNMLTLLRAFEHLAHERKLGLKLILTGDIANAPQLNDYIAKHRLQADVICLRNLSTTELAACYRLAEVAVNPSLSEGGCPFTFTEALSVGTPVVMSRIPVTLEVLTDPLMREATLFDPYDWRDIANRIEWAILNRAQLLTLQRTAYATLSTRTWADVAREHTDLLDAIAAQETSRPGGNNHAA